MLILRGIAAVLVGLVFTLALAVTVLLVRIDQTLLNGAYYTEQLRDRGAYEFLMVDLLGSAARDALNSPEEVFGPSPAETFLEESGLTAGQVVAAVHAGLSPEQLRRMVEPAVLGTVRFATGDEDEVRIRFDAGPPVRGMLGGGLALMRSSGFYEWFIDTQILPAVSQYSGGALSADPEIATGIVRRAITADWLAATVEDVAGPVADYVFAESDEFRIRVKYSDAQAESVANEIARALTGEQVTGLVRTHVLAPAVADGLGIAGDLHFDPYPAAENAAGILLAGAPAAALEPQILAFADDLSYYLSGRSNSFSTEFDFTAMKESARPELALLASDVALIQLESLPECAGQPGPGDSVPESNQLVLPNCRPPGISGEELLNRTYGGADSVLVDAVLGAIPDRVTFTEADLREATNRVAGKGEFEYIEEWRSLVGQRFEYSHMDLRFVLGNLGYLEEFDEFRSLFADGIVLSADNPSPSGFVTATSAELQSIREWVTGFRRAGLVSIAVAATLLLIAGLLGGTTGPGRLQWSSAILLAVSLYWLLICWPFAEVGLSMVADQALTELDLSDEGVFSETTELARSYAIDAGIAVTGDLLTGPRVAFSALAVLGVAGLVGANEWRRRQQESISLDLA